MHVHGGINKHMRILTLQVANLISIRSLDPQNGEVLERNNALHHNDMNLGPLPTQIQKAKNHLYIARTRTSPPHFSHSGKRLTVRFPIESGRLLSGGTRLIAALDASALSRLIIRWLDALC